MPDPMLLLLRGVSGGVATADADGFDVAPLLGVGLVAVRLGMLPKIRGGLFMMPPVVSEADAIDEAELDRAGEMGLPEGPMGGDAAVKDPRCDGVLDPACPPGAANMDVGVGDGAGAAMGAVMPLGPASSPV